MAGPQRPVCEVYNGPTRVPVTQYVQHPEGPGHQQHPTQQQAPAHEPTYVHEPAQPQDCEVAARERAVEPQEQAKPSCRDEPIDLVDPRGAASALLRQQGLSAEAAQEAVDATSDVFVNSDALRWAEAAMMWVAEESEHRTEREKLANAMAASLAEEEERKTSAVPLPDRPDAELRQRFAASLLLPQLEGTSFGGALFALPALRSALVRLLELERQICCQWYPGPGAQQCFQDFGQELVAATPAAPSAADPSDAGRPKRKRSLTASTSGAKRQPGGSGAAAAGASAAAGAAAAAAAPDSSAAGASAVPDSSAAAAAIGPVAAEEFAGVLAAKVQFLREKLAWLPETPGELPPFLLPYAHLAAPAGGDDDEVVIFS